MKIVLSSTEVSEPEATHSCPHWDGHRYIIDHAPAECEVTVRLKVGERAAAELKASPPSDIDGLLAWAARHS